MITKVIYHAGKAVQKIYHDGKVIFQGKSVEPVIFHLIEDGKLIVLGALSAHESSNGLYLDCVPNVEWIYPVQNGNVLTIEQVYSAKQNGNVLEVE